MQSDLPISYVEDMIKWIRQGKKPNREIVFNCDNIGLEYEGKYVIDVSLDSFAARMGVCIGFTILSINGEKITCNSIIHSIINKARLSDVPLYIVFGMMAYEPQQKAILDVLILFVLNDFLESQYWTDAQTKMKKIKVYDYWEVLQNRVPIYYNKNYLTNASVWFKQGTIIQGSVEGDLLHHSNGWSYLNKGNKIQIASYKKVIIPLKIPLFSDCQKKYQRVMAHAIKSNIVKYSWLSQIKEIIKYIPISISILDISQPDQQLIYINKHFIDIKEYNKEDILGKNCLLLKRKGKKTLENHIGHKAIHVANSTQTDFFGTLQSAFAHTEPLCILQVRKSIFDPTSQDIKYRMNFQFDVGFSDVGSISNVHAFLHTLQLF